MSKRTTTVDAPPVPCFLIQFVNFDDREVRDILIPLSDLTARHIELIGLAEGESLQRGDWRCTTYIKEDQFIAFLAVWEAQISSRMEYCELLRVRESEKIWPPDELWFEALRDRAEKEIGLGEWLKYGIGYLQDIPSGRVVVRRAVLMLP